MAEPVASVKTVVVRGSSAHDGTRFVPEETAVAIVLNGSTHAVMMATPADLEDFAVGFALSEGIVAAAGEIECIEIVEQAQGIEARLWLPEGRAEAVAARRRAMAGPVGCGLCGRRVRQARIGPPHAARRKGWPLGPSRWDCWRG